MNLDKIKDPVQADNVEGRDRELERKITLVKIKYVEEMYGKSAEYFDLFLKILNFPGQIVYRYLEQQKKANPNLSESELDQLEDKFRKEVADGFKKLSDRLEGEERVNAAYDYLISVEAQYPPQDRCESKRFGLLRFNETRVKEEIDENIREELELSSGDTLVEIHLDDFFKLPGETVGVNKIKEWLSQLAEYIVEKSPESRGIIGNSWLFGHPVMKRLGFKIIKEFKDQISASGAYWSQLIDKDGEIDSGKLDFLIKNKRLPYDRAIGFIDVEDFLRKYLPGAKKGLVSLRRVDGVHERKMEKIKDVVQKEIKGKWNDIISGEISLEAVYVAAKDYFDFLEEMGVKEYFIDFIEECVRKKLTAEAVRADQDLIKRFQEKIEKVEKLFLDKKFIKYEVVID